MTGLAAAVSALRCARGTDRLLVLGASPQQLETPLAYFDQLITPTPVFFVRSHFGPPSFLPGRKVAVEGAVERPLSLTVDDLKHFPEVTVTAVLQCAGNGRSLMAPRVPGVQWGHGAMGQATWTGVRLADVLAKTGITSDAAHVHLIGADIAPKPSVPAFIRSIPLSRALDPTTLIAYRMNGEPLTLAHGAPMRLVVPGWAGDHWTKWLTHLRVAPAEADGFYMQTAYRFPVSPVTPGAAVPPDQMRPLTTVPVKSVIATPMDGEHSRRGLQEITGVAFSGDAAIRHVDISLDRGATWQRARLEGAPGIGRWQVFRYTFEHTSPGVLSAMCRATDEAGNVQPQTPVWNPSGYCWNAWHDVSWTVS